MGAATRQARGRWARLAERLGFTPVRAGRLRKRTVGLVGERDGYLVAVSPSHGLNSSSVDVLVRFPRGSTVRGLRDDILGEPELAAAFGLTAGSRRRRVPRSRRKAFQLGDGVALLRLSYAFVPPTGRRVERVVAGLVAAVAAHVRPLSGLCEICGEDRHPDVYLSDGVPAYVCERCAREYTERESQYAEMMRHLEPDYRRGLALGLGGALAFGLVAGAIAALGRILLPQFAFPIAIPVFVALGFTVSALASNGFVGRRVASTLLKAPAVAVASAVAFTARNVIASRTELPEPLSLALLWSASWLSLRLSPRQAGALLGAGLVGWLVEVVVAWWRGRRLARPRGIARLESGGAVSAEGADAEGA